jgi:hypothetical protein
MQVIPLGVYGINSFVHVCLILYRWVCKRQNRKQACHGAVSTAISSLLSIFYLTYIYISKNVFDVMTCVPADPPDGNTYMSGGAAEPCGKPGGTQLRLLPFAVSALLLYVLGYPAGLALFFFYKKEKIMLDQLLRAKGVGDDVLTNPYAISIRKTASRAYYSFKPDYFWWALCIVARKLLITCTYVMFAQIPAFQLAASLLIVFLAYAAQVKASPYMPPAEFDEVIRDHLLRSLAPYSIHARLQQVVKSVEERGRKQGKRTGMIMTGRAHVLNHALAILFNNNTVEAALLFCAVVVNLMAIMYAAVENTSFANSALPNITATIILVLSVSITYYTCVLVGEIVVQCTMRQERKARGKSKNGKKTTLSAANIKQAAYDAVQGNKRTSTSMAVNPLFTSLSEDSGDSGIRAQLMARDELPDASQWVAVKQQYAKMADELGTLTKELNTVRVKMSKVLDCLQVNTAEAAISVLSGPVSNTPARIRERETAQARPRKRIAYGPLQPIDQVPSSDAAPTRVSPGMPDETADSVTVASPLTVAHRNNALDMYNAPGRIRTGSNSSPLTIGARTRKNSSGGSPGVGSKASKGGDSTEAPSP